MKIADIEILEKIYNHDQEYFQDIELKDLIHAIDSFQDERNGATKHHLVIQGLNLFINYLENFESFDKESMEIYQQIDKIIQLIKSKITSNQELIQDIASIHSDNHLAINKTLISGFNHTPSPAIIINYEDLEESLDQALESLGDDVLNSIDHSIDEIHSIDPISVDEIDLLEFDESIIEQSLSQENLENTVFRKERECLSSKEPVEITLDSGGNCTDFFSEDRNKLNLDILKDSLNLKTLESLFYISMGFDNRKSHFYSYLLTKIFYKIQLYSFPESIKFEFQDFQINSKSTELNPQEQMVQILLYKLFKQEIPSTLEKESKFVNSMIYLRNLNLIEFTQAFNNFFYGVFEISIQDENILLTRNPKAQKLRFFDMDFEILSNTKELYDFINSIKSVKKHSYKLMILNLLRDKFVQEENNRLQYLLINLGLENISCLSPKLIYDRNILTINPTI